MAKPATTITLETGEYALVIGQDGDRMSVRVDSAQDFPDDDSDLPIPALLAVALATRLLEDPDFHDEMLEWYEQHADDEDGEEETGEDRH